MTSWSLWQRFGDNLSYNVLMLAIWFLGPMGLVLVAAGALTDRFTRLLGRLRDRGPVPGDVPRQLRPAHRRTDSLLRMRRSADRYRDVRAREPRGGARRHAFDACGLRRRSASPSPSGSARSPSCRRRRCDAQAAIQRNVYQAIEREVADPGGRPAVVLVALVLRDRQRPSRSAGDRHVGARLAAPDAESGRRDSVPARRPGGGAGAARPIPGRRFFRLVPLREAPFLVLVPLDGGAPRPLSLGS